MSARSLGPAQNIMVGCVYLALIMLWEITSWHYGPYRSIILSEFLFFSVLTFKKSCRFDELIDNNTRKSLYRYVVLVALLPVLIAFLSIGSVDYLRPMDGMVVAVMIIILWHQGILIPRNPRIAWLNISDTVMIAICLTMPAMHFVSGLLHPRFVDIATTTATAAKIIWSRNNPYIGHLDNNAIALLHDPKFGGYKYLPLMPMIYSSFVEII